MPFLFFLILTLLPPLSASAAELDVLAAGERPPLTAICEKLHANPELSGSEKKTAALLAGELRAAGFAVTEHFGRYGSGAAALGVVGVMRNGPGPVLLLRADMDALPVEERTGLPYASAVRVKSASGEYTPVMHACGHDIHTTALIGSARLLKKLKARWAGTLVLVGQPSEESGGGADAMLKAGLYTKFPKPDFALALHAAPDLAAGKVACREGSAMASADSIDIVIHGKGGHGAYPHLTRDPVVLAAQLVTSLQTLVSRENSPFDPAVVTVGSIHGGTRYNIIPDEVRLQLTVRAFRQEVRDRLIASVRRMAASLAAAQGLDGDLLPEVIVAPDYTPPVINDPALTRRVMGAVSGALGAQNIAEAGLTMGAEDFSLFSAGGSVPLVDFWVGTVDPAKLERSRKTGERLPPLHSSEFAPSAGPAVETGVKAMVAAALELLRRQKD